MSLKKSATTRLSLLAGSSLALAGLSAAASLVLAPTSALAANECGDPSANGTAADAFICPAATYPTGIQHTSNGDLSVTVVPGTNVGTGGIVTTAGATPTNPDDLTVRFGGSTTGNMSFSTAFPKLIDVQSQTGDILVDVATAKSGNFLQITSSNAATTHGIYAVSHGGGDVTVQRLTEDTNASFVATGAASIAALEARTIGAGDVTVTGGATRGLTFEGGQHGILASVVDGDLTISGPAGNSSLTSRGRLYGIRAEATGTGTVSIDNYEGNTGSFSTGLYGIYATTASGLLTINGRGVSSAANGTGVYMDSGGDAVFTGRASGGRYGIHVPDVAAGTTTTINLESETTGGTKGILAAGAGELLVNIVGRETGAGSQVRTLDFDFTGMASRVEVRVVDEAAWRPTGSSTVPVGNFSIHIDDFGGMITAGSISTASLEAPTVVTFADPATSLVNTGFIIVGPDNRGSGYQLAANEAELRLVGLREFRHSGTILLGSHGNLGSGSSGSRPLLHGATTEFSDGWYDDMLVFQDGTWIGEGGNIVFDVNTDRSQTTCTREAVTFNFGAADCVRIVNSTVEGTTYVTVNQIIAGDRGRLTQQMMDDGILLIDAPGSTVTAENFLIDPALDGFNARSQSLDKGLFQYVLLFDEEASQFKLFPTLTGAAYQLPMASTAAHNMWRLSTGSWLNRQADLRHSMPEGLGGGLWMRASGEQTDREITSLSTLGGLPFSVDNNHRQDTYAITGGVDIFSGSDGNTGYVVGLMGGYAHTDVGYDASANTQAMDAWTGGLYGGLVVGQLFVDAVVNANNVIIDTDAPGFGFEPEGTILSSRMISLGGQVEAGWRMLFDGGLFLEPLASVSYVRSKMDDLQIVPDDGSRPGLAVSFEDPSSFRAGVGGRFGIDTDVAGMLTQVSFLARTWQDLEGQNTASIHNLAFPDDPDIRVVDEFSDQFHEFAVGASIWSPNGIVSGFLNLGGKWGEDYEAKTGSMGVRVAW